MAGFFTFTSPFYKDMSLKKEAIASYNEALDNSKALEAERDKLTQKYNSIDLANLAKLQKLLPDNVDNIRLILEIEKIASPYGMVLKDVKYDASDKDKDKEGATTIKGGVNKEKIDKDSLRKDYGVWSLQFSTQGNYNNFINFIKDLENNLRIVDISSIQFSSATPSSATGGLTPSLSESYKYSFMIKTYWLKN